MSRFLDELEGLYGEFWRKEANEQLEKVQQEVRSGEISIDRNGVARNCIGRALMDDMLEIVKIVAGEKVSVEATRKARQAELDRFLEEYQEQPISEEEMSEMRAAFGPGTKVVNVLTGKEILL